MIFICNFDPFGKNFCVYIFENREINHDTDPALEDGNRTIFFNTRGKDKIDPELRELLDFFDNKLKKAPQSALVKALKNEFDTIKSNHENDVS